ncbi:hypothetical protein VKT23_020541 [Stygiomarasmius scandens]|uniref:Uncharacterized protein n=1 Tax=Marasmiellus scandens TaxID=2682957 RepID=A0ABR1ILC8_9AGAR
MQQSRKNTALSRTKDSKVGYWQGVLVIVELEGYSYDSGSVPTVSCVDLHHPDLFNMARIKVTDAERKKRQELPRNSRPAQAKGAPPRVLPRMTVKPKNDDEDAEMNHDVSDPEDTESFKDEEYSDTEDSGNSSDNSTEVDEIQPDRDYERYEDWCNSKMIRYSRTLLVRKDPDYR